jgi:hypothetical protein
MIGPFTLVDGGIWPHHEVEPRQSRLRLLNGAATRWNTMTTTSCGSGRPGCMWRVGRYARSRRGCRSVGLQVRLRPARLAW